MAMWFLFDFPICVVGYTVARVVLPLISFRRIVVQPLTSVAKNYNALGYRHLGDGRIEIADQISGFIGFLFFLALIFAGHLLISLI